MLNTPGTIDADYRGEIGVILVTLSAEDVAIEDGERICQMVVASHEQVQWTAVNALPKPNAAPEDLGIRAGNEGGLNYDLLYLQR